MISHSLYRITKKLVRSSLMVLMLVFTLLTNSIGVAHPIQPNMQIPTKAPNEYVIKTPIPISMKAPWPAGITFHIGRDGSFYEEGFHKNTTLSRDLYALDINGDTSSKEPQRDDGSLVLSVADGHVKSVKSSPGSGTCPSKSCNYGWNIVLIHSGGYESRYAHLRSEIFVKEGDWVSQGAPLGYIGDSGCCGEHLHFAVYYCDPLLPTSDCNKSENRYAVLPEPFDGISNLTDGQAITSSNFGIGYEQLPQKDIYDIKKLKSIFHKSFLETYRFFGGQFGTYGTPASPVKKFSGTEYYYQEFNENKNNSSASYNLKSTLFEDGQFAFYIIGPIWEKYLQLGGPIGNLGIPITQTYPYGSTLYSATPQGFRVDFEHGSLYWDKNSKSTTTFDENNAPWEVSFYRLPNFSDLTLTRRDPNINLSWTPVAYSGIIKNEIQLGASIIAKAKVDVGLIAIYQIKAEYQGIIEIKSDGKTILSGSSPDKVATLDSTSIKTGKTDIEVRFSQSPLKPAKIKITAQGIDLSFIPKVYAAEDYDINMTSIPEEQPQTIEGYDPPPFPDDPGSNNIPPITFSSSSSTILVLDTSGSMAEEDANQGIKIESARAAATNILNIIAAESQSGNGQGSTVGLVSFNDFSNTDAQLTVDVSIVQSALNRLSPGGGTGMAQGLQTGLSLFPSQSSGEKQMIILLSDGNPNIPLSVSLFSDLASIQQEVVDIASQAGDQGVCVYTVGFGVPGSAGLLNPSIDEDFLKRVAEASGCGVYYNAQNADQLANVFVELRHVSMGTKLFQKIGPISQGDQLDLGGVDIPANQELMLFTLNWPGSRLEAVIRDPGGILVDSNYPSATISSSSTLVSMIVNNPKPGRWNLSIVGAEVPEGTTIFNAVVSSRAGTGLATQPGGASFPLAVLLLVILGAGVGVYVYSTSLKRAGGRNRTAGSAGAGLMGLVGVYASQNFTLRDGFVIGRGSGTDLRLHDPAVSRQHACLRFAQGNWYIQDMDSRSGLFVNGRPVKAIRLNPGDTIQIGSGSFRFNSGGK